MDVDSPESGLPLHFAVRGIGPTTAYITGLSRLNRNPGPYIFQMPVRLPRVDSLIEFQNDGMPRFTGILKRVHVDVSMLESLWETISHLGKADYSSNCFQRGRYTLEE